MNNITFAANCQTTAMGIMPHTDVEKALKLALSLDIPFWPQLPNTSFYEDMYVQASEGFPGIIIDLENRKLRFDRTRFDEELGIYSERMNDPASFALSPLYSAVFHRFLKEDLSKFSAIRGQNIGAVSFGFRVTDDENKPIIYDDGIRSLMFDFMQKKINIQYRQLREKNQNAFVWLDEPGLGWVFSGLSGYGDVQAKREYADFLSGLEGIKGLHLCANVNLPYLLGMGLDLLSFDAFQLEIMPKGYAEAVAGFLKKGGVISWGIVPTDSVSLATAKPETLFSLLTGYWDVVAQNSGVTVRQIAEQALIAPARCCLKNIGRVGASGESNDACAADPELTSEEQVVEKAFGYLKELSALLRERLL
ncbi:MAG: hypothetical protein Q8O43_03255 [Dehalococcoidia bacterium]|nr:hypothetical protein [Dehalococcoidia bacterium]